MKKNFWKIVTSSLIVLSTAVVCTITYGRRKALKAVEEEAARFENEKEVVEE